MLHQKIKPVLNGTATASYAVNFEFQPVIQTIPISPDFGSTGTASFSEMLDRKTPFIRPMWAAVASGEFSVDIEHQKIIAPVQEIDAEFSGAASARFASNLGYARSSITPDFPARGTGRFTPQLRLPVVPLDVTDGTTADNFPAGIGISAFSVNLLIPEAPTPLPMVGWAAEVAKIERSGRPLRVWSGEGQLALDGKTYEGTTFDGAAFASISPIEHSVGSPQSRVTISMAVPSAAVRAMLNIDVGPVPIVVFNVVSRDGGFSWKRLPTGIAGRLSRPSFDLEGSVYTAEIETYSGDADRGEVVEWSHENQNRINVGTDDRPLYDLGFEFMRSYEKGVNINWPP